MTDEEIRLACLRLTMEHEPTAVPSRNLLVAKAYSEFVLGTGAKPVEFLAPEVTKLLEELEAKTAAEMKEYGEKLIRDAGLNPDDLS